MKISSLGALATAALLSMIFATPAMARVSLSSIDQKLDTILTGIGEPTKIVLTGDLEANISTLAGDGLEYRIPNNKRFFVREIACRSPAYTAVLNTRPFALSVTAIIPNPNAAGFLRQNIVVTPFLANEAPLLATIQSSVFESNAYFDGGDLLVMGLSRRGGGLDGSISRFSCVLTGFMTDI